MLSQLQTKPTWRVFLPGLGGWFFLFLLAGFCFARPQLLLWDGGTCRHLSTGTYVLSKMQIPTTNYVSALFPDVPWLTNSFLSDLILGGGWFASGLNGVVLLSALAIALGLTWAYQLGRLRGLGAVSGLIWLVLAVAACSVHWSARPHVFSYLAFLVLYYLNFIADLPAFRRLLLSSLVVLVWANLHGSFMLGVVMLAIKLLADVLEAGWSQGSGSNSAGSSPVRADFFTLIAALGASFINLRGPGLIPYLTAYLLHPMVLLRTDEFRSIDFGLGFQIWAFIVVFVLLFALWALSSSRPGIADLILMLFLFVSAVYSMRMIPYFVLAAAPAAAPVWRRFCDRVETDSDKAIQEAGGWLKRAASDFVALEGRMSLQETAMLKLVPAFLLVSAAMGLAFVLLPGLRIADFDERRMPVKAVDYLAMHKLEGLGFVYDNWGGYLYWRLKRPIFIDDWTNFYPLPFINDYLTVLSGQPGWQQILDRYHCQYALVPSGCALTGAIEQSPQWRRVIKDTPSQLYVRASAASGDSGVKP